MAIFLSTQRTRLGPSLQTDYRMVVGRWMGSAWLTSAGEAGVWANW